MRVRELLDKINGMVSSGKIGLDAMVVGWNCDFGTEVKVIDVEEDPEKENTLVINFTENEEA